MRSVSGEGAACRPFRPFTHTTNLVFFALVNFDHENFSLKHINAYGDDLGQLHLSPTMGFKLA